jgi:hypothetical protein
MMGSSWPLAAYLGNVKKVMNHHSEEYGKKRGTLPLEGGGKRVGVKDHARCPFYPSP